MALTKKVRPIIVGSDMEVFLEYAVSKQGAVGRTVERTPVPACGQIGGTKDKPIPIPGLGDIDSGFKMQEDGTALEFNVPPANNSPQLTQNFSTAREALKTYLRPKKLYMRKGCDIEFEGLTPKKYPQAFVVGCSPDIDAYTRKPREGLSVDAFNGHRFAGGHVHMSYDNKDNIPAWVMARFMDITLALPFLPLDSQGMRRKFYGQAGLFRDTEYGKNATGIEYRTLSNFWHFEDDLVNLVCAYTQETAAWVTRHPDSASDLFDKIPWGDVKKTIDSEDLKHGEELTGLVRNLTNKAGLVTMQWQKLKGVV